MKTAAEILLVDDSQADIDLLGEVLSMNKHPFHANSVEDGTKALCYLRRQGNYARALRPDLIVLDLNLPRLDGRQVLQQLKCDPDLSKIPVVVFTTSAANSDIVRCYELGANCYLTKPGNLWDFIAVVQSMANFWLGFASLPQKEER